MDSQENVVTPWSAAMQSLKGMVKAPLNAPPPVGAVSEPASASTSPPAKSDPPLLFSTSDYADEIDGAAERSPESPPQTLAWEAPEDEIEEERPLAMGRHISFGFNVPDDDDEEEDGVNVSRKTNFEK